MVQGIVLLVALTVAAMQAYAEGDGSETAESSYFSGTVFGVHADDDRNTDDEALGFQFIYGAHWRGSWFWETSLAWNVLENDAKNVTDFYQAHAGIDLAYRFGGNRDWTPFLLAGIGAVYDDVVPNDEDDTNPYANLGVGFISPVLGDSGIRLRGDLRYIHSEFLDGVQDIRLGVGVEIPLGRTRIETRTVVETVYREVPVPRPVADSDSDGVDDVDDRCPDTLSGAQVDAQGCAVKGQNVRLRNIHFITNSSQLQDLSKVRLESVVRFLQQQPAVSIVIEGHTDSVGSSEYNLGLSRARADSVRAHLVEQGIDARRMSTVGYGETRPVSDNETAEGRAENRRVEIRIEQ